ncbi:MAG: hypothetical protein ACHQUC_02525 [Chlamydiales bacterium]
MKRKRARKTRPNGEIAMNQENKLNKIIISKKTNGISESLATEHQKKAAPIQWETMEIDYDSGPKMGID